MPKYRVCGTRGVLGHLPGEQFDADIGDVQESRLVRGGHIERLIPEASLTGFQVERLAEPASEPAGPEVSEELPDDRAGEPDQERE